jgi:OOP family OmpA-OmpF porin
VEQVFLIHAESGLLLNHVTAADLDTPNADLISAMLTAIQDFVHDSFRPNEGPTLRTFTVGEHRVHLEAGSTARALRPSTRSSRFEICCVVSLATCHLCWR